jgi:molybdate transport system regulatory protein
MERAGYGKRRRGVKEVPPPFRRGRFVAVSALPAIAMTMSAPRVQFRLRITCGDDIAVGPGKVDLLEAIARSGSITGAAKSLGMSYRRAWLLVDTMNRCFREPVVEAEAGGRRGGGGGRTAQGAPVEERYRTSERLAAAATATQLRALMRRLR